MENFPERLKQLRKEHGLKQRDMADECGIQVRSYQQYEYSECYPDIPKLVHLADFFNVSVDYLLGRTDNREINRQIPAPDPDGAR